MYSLLPYIKILIASGIGQQRSTNFIVFLTPNQQYENVVCSAIMMLVTLLLGAVHFAPGRGSSIQPLTGTETITVDGNYVPLPAGGHGFNTSPLGVSRTLLQRLRAQGYTMTIERAEAFAEPGSDEGKTSTTPAWHT